MIKKNKKRVGIIIDTTLQTKQIWDLINLSKSSKNYEISTILINNNSIKNKNLFIKIIDYAQRRGFKKCVAFLVFQSLCKIESIFIKKSGRFPDFYNKYSLDELKIDFLNLNPIISKSGLIYRYPIEDLENIKTVVTNEGLVFNEFMTSGFHRYGIPKTTFIKDKNFNLIICGKEIYEKYYKNELKNINDWKIINSNKKYVALHANL